MELEKIPDFKNTKSHEELVNELIGVTGTDERINFNKEVKREVGKYKNKIIMKKIFNLLKKEYQLTLLILFVINISIANIINNNLVAWIVALALPALIGFLWVLFLNLIKLMDWLNKPKYSTIVKRFGKLKVTTTRNKEKVKDIEYYQNDSSEKLSSAPNTFEEKK